MLFGALEHGGKVLVDASEEPEEKLVFSYVGAPAPSSVPDAPKPTTSTTLN